VCVRNDEQIRGLTNLEFLRCGQVSCSLVDDATFLPTQLQSLVIRTYFSWHEGYLQLAQLRCLDVDAGLCGDFAPLTRMTQLTALKVTVEPWSEAFSEWDEPPEYSVLFQQLPKLPLVHLDVCDDKVRALDLQMLGQCTKLTYLQFGKVHMRASVQVFAEQLQKLRGLEQLSLVPVEFRPHPGADTCELFGPLVQSVQGLAGEKLRSVFLRGLTLSAAQTQELQRALCTRLDYQAGQLDLGTYWMDSSDMADGVWSVEDSDGDGIALGGGWDNSDSNMSGSSDNSDSDMSGSSDDVW
jgi:hypothetical protein